MKKHVLFFVIFNCCCFCLFSQKREKPESWIKNAVSISYDERIERIRWDPSAGLQIFTDSIKELDLNLINIGYLRFSKSGNLHEFEISNFSISLNRRKFTDYYEDLQLTVPSRYSKDINLYIKTKYQFNYRMTPNKSKNNFFIGIGWQPFYQYERLKSINRNTYPNNKIKRTKFGSHFIVAPRVLFFQKNRFLFDIGFSKTIFKFQKIIQNVEHGVPDRPEKFTESIGDFMPIDFEINLGIGIKLNSK